MSFFNRVVNNSSLVVPEQLGDEISLERLYRVIVDDYSQAPSTCHPGTREAVLEELSAWIRGPAESETPIYWLHGLAGTGKTTIAHTLSERFDVSCGGPHLAATFFFSRTSTLRNNPRFLFTTIAYRLAMWNNELQAAIAKVVEKQPAILGASIEMQYNELVVKPLHMLQSESWEKLPKVVIIDGLDECDGSQGIGVLKTILDEAMKGPSAEGRPPRSLRFLITSRSGPVIHDMFNQYCRVTAPTELSDDYSASRDITAFFHDGFTRIVRERNEIMTQVQLPWPTKDIINELVQRAGGQFIYAATVLKYIGNEYSLPNERLEIIMGLPNHDVDAFSDLDALYRQIMASDSKQDQLLQILGTWFAIKDIASTDIASINVIEYLLSIPKGVVSLVLRGIYPVVQITSTHSHFDILHESFHDFLEDPHRSKEYFINIPMCHEYLARRCLQILRTSDSQDHHPQVRNNDPFTYVLNYWHEHLQRAARTDDILRDLEGPFLLKQLHQVIEQSVGLDSAFQDTASIKYGYK